MGLYLTVYAGPLARCHYEVKESVTTSNSESTRHICVNPNCASNNLKVEKKLARFCSLCGQALFPKVTKHLNVNKKLTPTVGRDQYQDVLTEHGFREDVFEEVNRWHNNCDYLHWSPQEHWLLPGSRRENTPRTFEIPTDGDASNYVQPDPAAEIAWFSKVYQRELDVLRPIYIRLDVEWAIITYKS